MRNAIGILKLMSQGEDDVKQGNVTYQENVFIDIEKRVKRNAENV